MEMPDVVLCFPDYDTSGGWISCKEKHERENGEQYHHSRVKEQDDATIEALKAENEELKAKLEKAKGALREIESSGCVNRGIFSRDLARTTLGEIE